MGPSLSRNQSAVQSPPQTPSNITEFNPRVKAPVSAEEIECCLAVVVLVGFVNFGLGKDDQAGAAVVPFELDLVALEEVLLRCWRVEVRYIIYSNRGRLTLVLMSQVAKGTPLQ
jgi:hypothetical protein